MLNRNNFIRRQDTSHSSQSIILSEIKERVRFAIISDIY